MKRVETENSIWLFDEQNMQYMRMPKTEAPRPKELSSMLTDLEWLPYLSLNKVWDIYYRFPRYHIMGPESVLGTFTGPVEKDDEMLDTFSGM